MEAQNKQPNHDAEKTSHASRRIGKCVGKAAIAMAVLGTAFWLLWNWAAVPLFTFPPLTFLQALVAILLTGVLARMGRHMASRQHKTNHHHRYSFCHGIDRCRPDHS